MSPSRRSGTSRWYPAWPVFVRLRAARFGETGSLRVPARAAPAFALRAPARQALASLGLDADLGGHRVAVVGTQGDRGALDVGGLDAQHSGPFVVAEVGHRPGLLHPGIPDDRRVRASLGDGDPALQARVVNHARRLRAQIHAVGFAGEPDRLGTLTLTVAADLVEILGILQPRHADLLDVADGEVGVQRLLEAERDAIGIVDEKREGQRFSDR